MPSETTPSASGYPRSLVNLGRHALKYAVLFVVGVIVIVVLSRTGSANTIDESSSATSNVVRVPGAPDCGADNSSGQSVGQACSESLVLQSALPSAAAASVITRPISSRSAPQPPATDAGAGADAGAADAVDADAATAIGHSSTRQLSSLPCPTVYIYMDAPAGDSRSVVATNLSQGMQTFGIEEGDHPGIYESNPFVLAQLMQYRVLNSGHCRWTRDPAEADLFIIPSLSSPKGAVEWISLCNKPSLWGSALVKGPDGYSLSFLPHLNAETARRHLFFISKGHYVASQGLVACAWIQGVAPAAPYFADVQKFAYSHTYAGYKFGKRKWEKPGLPVLDGRVVSVPYPASVHWSERVFGHGRVPPWQNFTGRSTVIHYVAGLHGKQLNLRKALFNACRALGEPRCRALDHFEPEVMLEKARAVFCLEPEGDSPFRKSVYDSITMGCIPVLFSHDSDLASSWHWGPFRQDSRVLLSEADFMALRKRKQNGLQALLDIPPARVAEMQAAIARNAHRLQFSLDDMPGGDDAFEVLLKKAHLRALNHSLAELAEYW